MTEGEPMLDEFLASLESATDDELIQAVEQAQEDSKESWMFDEEC